MHNDFLEKMIENKKEELKERELLEKMVTDKEREFEQKQLPLSAYSTTQLKAELRRRKKER